MSLIKMHKFFVTFLAAFFLFTFFVYSEEYDATVTTESGSYTVPVEVEDGAVTQVHWPNGGDMNVYGGDISGGEASGTNSRGDNVGIALDDYPADSSEGGESEESDS